MRNVGDKCIKFQVYELTAPALQVYINKTFSYTDPKFEASNNSMTELRTSVGNSYKCSSKENLQITDQALVNVFNVQLQVFKIDGDKFGPGKRSAFGSPCQTQDL